MDRNGHDFRDVLDELRQGRQAKDFLAGCNRRKTSVEIESLRLTHLCEFVPPRARAFDGSDKAAHDGVIEELAIEDALHRHIGK